MPTTTKKKHCLMSTDEVNAFIEHLRSDVLAEKLELQRKNYGFDFDVKGAFEYHITVRVNDTNVDKFVSLCKKIGLKAIFIELPYGQTLKQLMTSKYITGTYPENIKTVYSIAHRIQAEGFEILRVKIESLACNKGVPQTTNDIAYEPKHRYFEFHFKVLLNDQNEKKKLAQIGQKYNAHTSRNAFKQFDDGKFSNFLTMRAFGKGRVDALKGVNALKNELVKNGFEILGCEKEYVVYDSNLELDKGWVKEENAGNYSYNELYSSYMVKAFVFLCSVASVYSLYTTH